jgi:excinuclease ABC subunit B
MEFKLVSNYKPYGDQIPAIKSLVENFGNGIKEQVLLGATGTGKTFTIANVIKEINKPTLVLAHNKTLAGQLYSELKSLFPNNHVAYFISYYDYYQPEAYVASSDTYIEKDAQINEEIDEMRHAATADLIEYKDTIIVASVSCIYGIGDPETYEKSMLRLRVGETYNIKKILNQLVDMQYIRNELDFKRGTFRKRGDVLEIIPANEKKEGIRIDFFDEEVERISLFDVVTGKANKEMDYISIFPATHFVTDKEKLAISIQRIKDELAEQVAKFNKEGKPLEAERIEQRTKYDIEMLEQMGFCSGVENYSRHLSLRGPGETPATLIDFFKKDFLLVIDESHVTIPQIRGMYNGDRSRKENLVNFGFRLPSALDNRPLKFQEFENKTDKLIYLSATPGEYELSKDIPVVEQIIRPTGLLDPIIEVRPTIGQIDDLYNEILIRKERNERVLVTTLTIRMSEDLTAYLKDMGLSVAYLHSEIKSLERIEIIKDLRLGKYDCIVGINLLREGLDIPEVSLVAILDANKEGFLRSDRSLVQTIGRAARNSNGRVIMYADDISKAMEYAIKETQRRREIQEKYNLENNIIPKTIVKEIYADIRPTHEVKESKKKERKLSITEINELLQDLEHQMYEAASKLDFEYATILRDSIMELKAEYKIK